MCVYICIYKQLGANFLPTLLGLNGQGLQLTANKQIKGRKRKVCLHGHVAVLSNDSLNEYSEVKVYRPAS